MARLQTKSSTTNGKVSMRTQRLPLATPGTEEDDSEDDEISVEASKAVDIQKELQEALDDENFEFRGSFYHGSLLTNPPNPGLSISGLGLVGLPLSDRDAKAIISCASMAPFGKGERLVVDKEVRDTWEIEASRVSFKNTTWQDFVNKTLCAQLCTSLGIHVGANPPKLELYKLLLYETGSHFLPHQDTQKADGMFATAIIILPSAYTGGQVIVSHASSSKTINFAEDSLFSMALLAWYTDVKHEVKPVTSGYRLALSYNMIHVSPPGVPRPCLPEMQGAIHQLRKVLTKWRHNKYETSPNLMAYLLDHQYSPANLSKGLKSLKGVDLHRVSFLRPVAEELGFRVGIGLLVHNVSGQGLDGGFNYYRKTRRHYDWRSDDASEDDEDGCGGRVPDMEEVGSKTTTLSGIVDLNGCNMLSAGEIKVEPKCLMPNAPFKGKSPDEKEYEGYQGNYPGQVDHWYRRSALVLIHEDGMDEVCFSIEGAPYAFRKLQKSTAIPPTADDRRWADRLLEARSLQRKHILTLVDLALKWKDPAIWKSVTSNPACLLSVVDSTILFNAMEIFSFEVTRLSFETLLARSNTLPERLDFLSRLPSKASASEKDAVDAWHRRELKKILSAYTPVNAKDIPTVLSIIRLFGLKIFEKRIMPNITKNTGNYAFCMAFMESLAQNRQTIVEQESRACRKGTDPHVIPNPPTLNTSDVIDGIIKQCLQVALPQWDQIHHRYQSIYVRPAANFNPSPRTDRIIELIEQAIVQSDLEICKTLFTDILKKLDPASKKFQEIYIPLLPRLRTLLASKNLSLLQPPFVDFVQLVIGLYLRDVLGKKNQLSNINLRKIGCGCEDCKLLDNFIFNYTKSTTTIRIVQARRLHLERQAATAQDLCTYQTIRSGSPYGIELQKLPTVVEASTWIAKQKAAKTFLDSIGSDKDISRIMGKRYANVKCALDGTRSFTSVPATLWSTSTNAGLILAATAAAAPARPTTTRTVPQQLAGTKRKTQPKAHLGTFDLTG